MIFSGIKGITIPEGVVQQIADGAGSILWKGGVDVAAMAISYTGTYTDQLDVVMSGKTYRLLTLTGSGTLTVPEEVTADVWMCNGGNGGCPSGGPGGGGGRVLQSDGVALSLSTVCTIGAGGGVSYTALGNAGSQSSFGTLKPNAQSSSTEAHNGASGGGGGGYQINNGGSGDGVATVPFGETTLFDKHSAGGGGGGYRRRNANKGRTYYEGGDGGSNGSKGNNRTYVSADALGGSGGEKGGGNGSQATTAPVIASSATFYGSGGGGGAIYRDLYGESEDFSAGAAGYQGVIYVRIPYEQ